MKKKNKKNGYAYSYNAKILNYFNPELQLRDIESVIKNILNKLLTELRGFKFVTKLILMFKKIESDTFYSHSNAGTIKNENDIDDMFE